MARTVLLIIGLVFAIGAVESSGKIRPMNPKIIKQVEANQVSPMENNPKFVKVDYKTLEVRQLVSLAYGSLATYFDQPVQLFKIVDVHKDVEVGNQYHVRLWVREEGNGPAYVCYVDVTGANSPNSGPTVNQKLCSKSIAAEQFDEMISSSVLI